jgi:heat shock protein HslJ
MTIMNNIWRWILGIFVGLVIIGFLVSVRSNQANYNAAHGDTQTSFQEVTWEWVQLNDQTKNEVTNIPDPSKYNILFHADGTLEGKADCNNFAGTYSQENGGFSITLGPSTLAYCGDQSMDSQYLALLSSVVAGGPAGTGQFALETAGGAQRLDFKN